jgi:hypothetical protein
VKLRFQRHEIVWFVLLCAVLLVWLMDRTKLATQIDQQTDALKAYQLHVSEPK